MHYPRLDEMPTTELFVRLPDGWYAKFDNFLSPWKPDNAMTAHIMTKDHNIRADVNIPQWLAAAIREIRKDAIYNAVDSYHRKLEKKLEMRIPHPEEFPELFKTHDEEENYTVYELN